MTTHAPSRSPRPCVLCGPRLVVSWICQAVVAGVFALGAYNKFFNYNMEGSEMKGSEALAAALDVGREVVAGIGAIEAVVAVLILIPRAAAVAAVLAICTMAGALLGHATKIGWDLSDPVGQMWPLAVIALAAACVVLIIRRRQLPIIGQRIP